MNGYIINPSFFYWVNVIQGMSIVVLIFAMLASVLCLFGLPLYYGEEVYNDEDKKAFRKIAKKTTNLMRCIVDSLHTHPLKRDLN